LLDLTARRYGCRPSALLGIPAAHPAALELDATLALHCLQAADGAIPVVEV